MPVSRGRPVWRRATETIDHSNFYSRPTVYGKTGAPLDFELLYGSGGPMWSFAKETLVNLEDESSEEEESPAEKSSVEKEVDDDTLDPSSSKERENLEMLLALPMSNQFIRNTNFTNRSTKSTKPLSKSLRTAIDELSASYDGQSLSKTESPSSYEELENRHLDPHNYEAFPAMPSTKAPKIERHETNLPSYASMAGKPAPSGPQRVFKKRVPCYESKRYLTFARARDCIHYIPFGKPIGSDVASKDKKATRGNADYTAVSGPRFRKGKDEQPYAYKPTKEQTWEWQAKKALEATLDELVDHSELKQVRGNMKPCEKLQETGSVAEEAANG